ncbi:MAG: multidrug ABC transporter ATP-binding protein, partial [Halobacteriota archaeon]
MRKGSIVELPLACRAMTKAMLRRTSALDGMERIYKRKGKVVARALNATSKLPKIVRHIECAGRGVSDLSVRRNLHEDVFFSLTGRTLRE